MLVARASCVPCWEEQFLSQTKPGAAAALAEAVVGLALLWICFQLDAWGGADGFGSPPRQGMFPLSLSQSDGHSVLTCPPPGTVSICKLFPLGMWWWHMAEQHGQHPSHVGPIPPGTVPCGAGATPLTLLCPLFSLGARSC